MSFQSDAPIIISEQSLNTRCELEKKKQKHFVVSFDKHAANNTINSNSLYQVPLSTIKKNGSDSLYWSKYGQGEQFDKGLEVPAVSGKRADIITEA